MLMVAELEIPLRVGNVVISLDLELVGSHSKLTKGFFESMHPMFACVLEFENKTIPRIFFRG